LNLKKKKFFFSAFANEPSCQVKQQQHQHIYPVNVFCRTKRSQKSILLGKTLLK